MTHDTDAGPAVAPASSACQPTVATLTRRAQFLRAAKASRAAMPGFVLQGRDRADGDPRIGIGFTASKKVGNAVARNRAKRRLRAIARDALPKQGQPGWDYVLIARAGTTAELPFDRLRTDLGQALNRLRPRTG